MRQVGVGVRKRRRAKRNLFVHETDFVRRMRLRMCVCVFIVVQWGLCIFVFTYTHTSPEICANHVPRGWRKEEWVENRG